MIWKWTSYNKQFSCPAHNNERNLLDLFLNYVTKSDKAMFFQHLNVYTRQLYLLSLLVFQVKFMLVQQVTLRIYVVCVWIMKILQEVRVALF